MADLGKLYLLFKSFYLNKNFKLLNLLVLSYRTKIDVLFCHDNVSDLLISYSYLEMVAMQVVPVVPILEMRKECCQMELNVSLALMQLLQYRCDPIMRFYRLVRSQHDFQSWENLIPQICIASGLST